MPTRGHRGTPPFGTQASGEKTTRFGRFTYSPKEFFCLLDLVHLWYVHDAQVEVPQCHLATLPPGGSSPIMAVMQFRALAVALLSAMFLCIGPHAVFADDSPPGQRGRDYAGQGCPACPAPASVPSCWPGRFRLPAPPAANKSSQQTTSKSSTPTASPPPAPPRRACALRLRLHLRRPRRHGLPCIVTCETTSRAEEARQVSRESAWRAEPPRRAASRCPRRSERGSNATGRPGCSGDRARCRRICDSRGGSCTARSADERRAIRSSGSFPSPLWRACSHCSSRSGSPTGAGRSADLVTTWRTASPP